MAERPVIRAKRKARTASPGRGSPARPHLPASGSHRGRRSDPPLAPPLHPTTTDRSLREAGSAAPTRVRAHVWRTGGDPGGRGRRG
jgi:hypothetical protein